MKEKKSGGGIRQGIVGVRFHVGAEGGSSEKSSNTGGRSKGASNNLRDCRRGGRKGRKNIIVG